MNHIFSVLWNSALGRFCVTSELGRGRCRATTRRTGRTHACRGPGLAALAAGVALAWSAPASAQATLPQGGQVVGGDATIGHSGQQMTVWQSSDNAIVNWQSFNIGANQQVTFQQPNHTAVALNRVIGAEPTAIHGSLQANGRVFLVNPNGMLFGAGANVNVGGFVASTLDISDKDFLRGNYRFSGQGSGTQGAALRNQGRITAADGGAVALLGGSVSNQGTIAARLGAVALAAGNQVKLDFAGDGLLNVQVQQSSLNALVENHQLIQADGGSVLMTAKATDALLQTVVNNTGTVRARTVENRAGKIVLLGGFDGGTTRVAGTLDASAPNGGDGGFVDTSGAHVQIEADTRVTTRAAQGKTGTWLIDPTDFTIGAGAGPQTDSGIGADTLMANLADNNVTLQTVAAGPGAGDMHVNAAVSWNEHELTLNAHRNININAVMSVNGDGKLALNYGGTQGSANSNPVGNSNINFTVGGRVDFAKTGMELLAVNGHSYTVINSLAALQDMAADRNISSNFALGGNIDASATADWSDGGFRPIGSPSRPFRGIFDGLGHTIDNLFIYRPNEDSVGLFGATSVATLRNIGLAGGSVTGFGMTGSLVGFYGGGSISNAYATSNVSGRDATGGLVGGQTGGNISNAYATGSVTGSDYVGGLVGLQGDGDVSNAYATGSVTGINYVGGLVGYPYGNISNAYATGSVTGSDYVGGLVGYQRDGSISNAYATGWVTGNRYTGGLVGYQYSEYSGSISNAYWDSKTTGQSNSAGGGTGLTTAQMFDASRWTGFDFGTVWGNAKGQTTPYLLNMAGNQVFNKNDLPVGPITAENRPALYTAVLNVHQLQAVQNNLSGRYLLGNDIEASATASWNDGAGFASIGGAGDAFTGVFDGLGHHIDHLTIHRPEQENVGLFGHTRNATLRNVGLVGGSVSGSSAVGMLVGLNEATNGNASVTNAFATGEVTARESGAGGLIGVNQATEGGTSTVSNSHAGGRVTGNTSSGGLVGSNAAFGDSTAHISGSYATGEVSGVQDAGGLVGSNMSYGGTASIADSHASANVSATGDDAGGLVGSNLAYGGDATIERAYASGNVTAVYRAGGLVGSNVGGDRGSATIDVAFANGNVTVEQDDAGGLVGANHADGGTAGIANAYATGQVFAAGHNAGGLVGSNRAISGDAGIVEAYATGQVTATGGNAGGLVGRHEGDDKLINRAHWDSETTGQSASAGGGSALTTAQMKRMASFAGWDISDAGGSDAVWRIYEGHTAPLLLGFMQPATVATMEESVTREYNGERVFDGIEHDHSGNSRVLGALRYTASSKNAGSYSGENLLVGGLYSSQLGYDISYGSAATLHVTPGKISQVTGITAQNRTYNGELGVNLLTLGAHFEGRLGNDQLNVATASGTMDTKNAGDGKAVGITGITLGGDDRNNYALVRTTASTKVDIAKALIDQVTGITAENRSYNGEKNVDLLTNGAQFQGRLGNDQLTVATASGAMDTKNAGDGKAVDITGITLGGTDAGNYTLVKTTAETKVHIEQRAIKAVITADDKTYDATMAAVTHAQLGAVLSQDQVTLATSGSFATKDAGADKTVHVSGSLTGTDAGNYRLEHNQTATADIAPRVINAVITADGKTYDATRAAVTHGQLGALLGEDQVMLATSGIFATKDAGTDKTVNVSGSLAGRDAGNYRLGHNATTTADISQLAIHASIAADDKDYDGSTAATTRGALTGVLAGDRVALRSRGSFLDPAAGAAKLVRVSATLDGEDAGNYRLEHNASTQAAIHPEATVTAAVPTEAYDGAHPSRIEVARPEVSASFNACLGDVYPMPAQVMNLGSLAVADAQQYRQQAIVFARVGGSVSDRACARTPF